MKSVFRAASALCLVACAIPATAEPLTTGSIISLAKTGIGEETIIANVTKPGEYGFIFAPAGTGTGGAMTARIFDFSVQ